MFHLVKLKKHWHAELAPNENLKNILNSSYNLIYGNILDLYKEDSKSNYYDYLFICLNDSDKIYPNSLS